MASACLFISLQCLAVDVPAVRPEHMMVTWVTFDYTETVVRYGPQRPTRIVHGSSTSFQSKEKPIRTIWVHRVLLRGLTPGQTYRYNVGGKDGWSPLYTLQAKKSGSDWSPRLALYGDLGNENGRSIATLQTMAQQGDIDCVLHFGDMAYDMYENNFKTGDEWMRQLEPIAAYVPYITSPGNHEAPYNFLNYNSRFTNIGLDGKINNFYHSFNIGPLHVVMYSVEYYYFGNYYKEEDIRRQYEFIVKDLEEATKPENRRQRPWILALTHRAMYCSTNDTDDCRYVTNRARVGHPKWGYGLEPVLQHYGVDLHYAGHEHTYERLYPVYNYKVYNGSNDAPYTNARAPIHVISGNP
ncbi:ACP7, partial [Cordylochernes scorpioides]